LYKSPQFSGYSFVHVILIKLVQNSNSYFGGAMKELHVD